MPPPSSAERPATPPARRPMVLIALVLVAAHLAFRAWAVLGAFFYSDDYRLVHEAKGDALGFDSVLASYDALFMPFGRFLAWVAAQPELMSWPLHAGMSLVLQAGAALACLWMLVTLFGWRWRMLALLAFYLTSAMTMPAFVWWAAALNQVPVQVVFFASVAAWVRYLRSRRLRWLALTLAVLAFGLACYVKTLLVLPALAFLAVAYFATGGPVSRVVQVVRSYWPAAVAGVAGGVAFLVYYLASVPQLASGDQPRGVAALAETMLGTSFSTAVVGGPWRWDNRIPPAGLADPPALAVHASWVVIALVVPCISLRRERTVRAWVFLGAWVAADFVLLLTTRAQAFGAIAGLEYRYLTDAMCAVVLGLGLATMELRGAAECSQQRAAPLLTRVPGKALLATGMAVVLVGGVWSAACYAHLWHEKHPGKRFLTTARSDLDAQPGKVDLVNQQVSSKISGSISGEHARTDFLLPLLTDHVVFPTVSERLHLLDERGRLVDAEVTDAVATDPGPAPGCGWKLTASSTSSLPLRHRTLALTWWLRIDYLASQDSGLTVRAGETTRQVNLRRGLHRLYVRADGVITTVRLEGLDPGTTLCVDKVTVGEMEPAAGGEEP